MRAAEAATAAAAGTPGGPAAKLAEETLKASLALSMGSAMSAFGGMSDIHICPVPVPIPPHGPGVVIDGSPTVLINNMPACREGDTVLEALGGPDKIVMGFKKVLIGDSGSGGAGGSGSAVGGGNAASTSLLSDVVAFGKGFVLGFAEGVVGTVEGIWNLISDPVGVAEGVVDAVVNYEQTYDAICDAAERAANDLMHGTPEEKGRVVGLLAEAIAENLLTAGGGGAAKGAKAADAMADVAKGAAVADKAAAAGRLSRGAKMGDVGRKLNAVETMAMSEGKGAFAIAARERHAHTFYKDALADTKGGRTTLTRKSIPGHMDGIDLTKPVGPKLVKKGEIVERWVGDKELAALKRGDPLNEDTTYLSPPGADPKKLGFDTKKKTLVKMRATQDIEVLESTAADIPDWNGSNRVFKGGEQQYFTKDGSSFEYIP